jgi:NUMOD4 motif/HNH endonuclease
MEEHIDEQWRDVAGYEGIYEVSDLGRVQRIKSGKRTKPGLILKGDFDRWGYRRVQLYHGSKSSWRRSLVHILVAEAFIGSKPAGFDCNHKNGDKSDNRAQNLEYLDRKSHDAHTRNVLGRFPTNRGSQNGQALLTAGDVHIIRFLYSTGNYRFTELAALYHVSSACIKDIIHRRRWQHLQ